MTQLELPLAGVLEIEEIYEALEPEARKVLLKIARRLQAGQAEYGRMQVATDPRDFMDEVQEECLDTVMYIEMDRLRRYG
jgi:hypothetical protein